VRRGRSFVVGLSYLFALRPALGQHCQPPTQSDGELLRTTLRAEAAHYESGPSRGYYEGLGAGADLRAGVLRARAGLPYYRLLEPTGEQNGFGDLFAKLEASLYEDERWSVGPAFSASFPTGDASKRLGMGHVMLGPSVFGSWQSRSFFVGGEFGYNQALVGGEAEGSDASAAHTHAHHHHSASQGDDSASGPIPNPMNAEELWLGLNASYDALSSLRVSVGSIGAVPTSKEGATRVTATGGVEFPLGALSTAVGIEVDLAGTTRREVVLASVAGAF